MRNNANYFLKLKKENRKAVLVTAYSFPIAQILDENGVDLILVGDSAAMTMMGYEDTLSITVEEMAVFVKSVSRAVRKAMVIADMPFLSYSTVDKMFNSVEIFMKYCGADGIKMEGGKEISDKVKMLTDMGVPVVGHIGLMPQHVKKEGYKKKKGSIKDRLLEDAIALQKSGAFSIIIENTDEEITEFIHNNIDIPIYGIGAGKSCDGQIIVIDDIIGLYPSPPSFARVYGNVRGEVEKSIKQYIEDVKNNKFPY